MSRDELIQCLAALNISQVEAAKLLNIDARTVRRWVEGAPVPGPAAQALRAWNRLHERNLAWRPDSVTLLPNDQQHLAIREATARQLDEMILRVAARGGASIAWKVSSKKCVASFDACEISFHLFADGGFTLGAFTRRDMPPDIRRDWRLIEDAAFLIARTIMRDPHFGPVTLVHTSATALEDGRYRIHPPEPYDSNIAAFVRALELLDAPAARDFHIRPTASHLPSISLWDSAELRKENRARKPRRA